MITDAGLVALTGLKELEELRLDGCPVITDAGLSRLHGLKKLRLLRLNGTSCTVDAARHLKERFLKETTITIADQEL